MLLTEEEARRKRCCGPFPCGVGPQFGDDINTRWCIASECMAWRRGPVEGRDGSLGYCGLSGKPE